MDTIMDTNTNIAEPKNDKIPLEELTPKESFEIKITAGSQEQYVLIPAGEKYIRIELVYISGATRNVLAFSPVIEIPQGSESLNNIQPGKQNDYPEIIKLSGIEKILLNQYKNHRHSFSG